MSVSSGIGDDVGRSPIPSIFENDTRGIVEVSKERLGIVQDTIQISFTELGGQVWKYQGNANRPVLPPLVSTRMQTPAYDEDVSWKASYEELLNTLPPLIREKFTYDSRLPLEERDSAYVALGDLLETTARALAWLKAAKEPIEPGSIEERYAIFNMLLPLYTAQATAKEGQLFFDKAREYLNQVGANYIYRDKLSDTINQAQYALNNMKQALDAYG